MSTLHGEKTLHILAYDPNSVTVPPEASEALTAAILQDGLMKKDKQYRTIMTAERIKTKKTSSNQLKDKLKLRKVGGDVSFLLDANTRNVTSPKQKISPRSSPIQFFNNSTFEQQQQQQQQQQHTSGGRSGESVKLPKIKAANERRADINLSSQQQQHHHYQQQQQQQQQQQNTSATLSNELSIELSMIHPEMSAFRRSNFRDEISAIFSREIQPQLPVSRIPNDFHVYETQPVLPPNDKDARFLSDKGVWEMQLFPSAKPTSRLEVVHLAQTIDAMIEKLLRDSEERRYSALDRIKYELDIFDISTTEIIRQVFSQCAERGVLLDKIRKRQQELFTEIIAASYQNAQKLEEEIQRKSDTVNKLKDLEADLEKKKKLIHDMSKALDLKSNAEKAKQANSTDSAAANAVDRTRQMDLIQEQHKAEILDMQLRLEEQREQTRIRTQKWKRAKERSKQLAEQLETMARQLHDNWKSSVTQASAANGDNKEGANENTESKGAESNESDNMDSQILPEDIDVSYLSDSSPIQFDQSAVVPLLLAKLAGIRTTDFEGLSPDAQALRRAKKRKYRQQRRNSIDNESDIEKETVDDLEVTTSAQHASKRIDHTQAAYSPQKDHSEFTEDLIQRLTAAYKSVAANPLANSSSSVADEDEIDPGFTEATDVRATSPIVDDSEERESSVHNNHLYESQDHGIDSQYEDEESEYRSDRSDEDNDNENDDEDDNEGSVSNEGEDQSQSEIDDQSATQDEGTDVESTPRPNIGEAVANVIIENVIEALTEKDNETLQVDTETENSDKEDSDRDSISDELESEETSPQSRKRRYPVRGTDVATETYQIPEVEQVTIGTQTESPADPEPVETADKGTTATQIREESRSNDNGSDKVEDAAVQTIQSSDSDSSTTGNNDSIQSISVPDKPLSIPTTATIATSPIQTPLLEEVNNPTPVVKEQSPGGDTYVVSDKQVQTDSSLLKLYMKEVLMRSLPNSQSISKLLTVTNASDSLPVDFPSNVIKTTTSGSPTREFLRSEANNSRPMRSQQQQQHRRASVTSNNGGGIGWRTVISGSQIGRDQSATSQRSTKPTTSSRYPLSRRGAATKGSTKYEDYPIIFAKLLSTGDSNGGRPHSWKWVNKVVIEIYFELISSDIDPELIKDEGFLSRFVYDYHLLKYGLQSIAHNYLVDFLVNLKRISNAYAKSTEGKSPAALPTRTTSNARVGGGGGGGGGMDFSKYLPGVKNPIGRIISFVQWCGIADWCQTERQQIYSPATLAFYLTILQASKPLLSKKALKELEEGRLFINAGFIQTVLERLKLQLSEADTHSLFRMLEENASGTSILFDEFLRTMVTYYFARLTS